MLKSIAPNFLFYRLLDATDYPTEAWLERVVILGPPSGIKSAKINSQSESNFIINFVFFFGSINLINLNFILILNFITNIHFCLCVGRYFIYIKKLGWCLLLVGFSETLFYLTQSSVHSLNAFFCDLLHILN